MKRATTALTFLCLALFIAAGQGCGKKEPPRPETPTDKLMKAARAGDLPAVTALLDADAELVNARDADRKTALHHAATAGNLDVVKLLVERGADVSVRDRWNITPMGRAALHQHTPVAEYLAGAPGADKGEKGVAGMFLDHNIAIDKSNDAADGVDTSRPRK